MKLKGKAVLVTGAGRGIGKALALGFAAEGSDVVVVSRTRNEIEVTAEEIKKLGRKALAVEADVSQEDDVRRIIDDISERMGRLDVIINNAALRMIHIGNRDSYLVRVSEITIEDWDKVIATNLRGPFLVIKMCLPLLAKAGVASIINISAGEGNAERPGVFLTVRQNSVSKG
jgi:NAD(P)-dependent dehydrogenase (short-subunit alcohol dehydrogenase family)